MSSELALLIVTGVAALSLFGQHVLPFVTQYFGTEQDRWFTRGVTRQKAVDARHSEFFRHIADLTKTQAEIVATLQVINQTQSELQHQIATIDRSLLTLAAKQTDIEADMADIKDYTERATDIALGLEYERRKG